jgi:hypothetical protein
MIDSGDQSLLEALRQRAAANRDALTGRQNTKKIASTAEPVLAEAARSKQRKKGTLLQTKKKRDLYAFTRKGGSILYMFIFDENDSQPEGSDEYIEFRSNPLYRNVFNGSVVQIPEDSGGYSAVKLPAGWDQPILRLPERNALGLYDLLSEESPAYNAQKYIPEYSIIYLVIDNSGSMTVNTVKEGIQEFFTRLHAGRSTRPEQIFFFKDSDLEESLAIADLDNVSADWYTRPDLKTYLRVKGKETAYRSRQHTLVFVDRIFKELIVPPIADFFDWMGEDELSFYRVPGRP